MKKMMKSVLGVTLLEIMLVLAIAAMIIVMSVRYYQSASANQQANTMLQMIQGITAAADGLAQGAGGYTTATDANVQPLMPNNSLTTPWGAVATLSAPAATGYTVTFPSTPAAVCRSVSSKLAANPKYTTVTTATACGTTGSVSFSYSYVSTN